ncbi:hypothetical protein [Ramlibacter sp. WS9]|uniref:hypothetical protein n=1 Tax=Ramlibacter sp. WS9 TaxID=1882741 RepID=UPI00114235CC|nr:hypothetical protein [Ramlibacter sp. WS9]ROZ74952.1 hypothetical protein EEB15_16345 [Ramlibacter sp. WS9]
MTQPIDASLRRSLRLGAGLLLASAPPLSVRAQKKDDPGATDTEIRLGNLMPYSGPASAYGTLGKAMAAYFDKANAAGGINGRKGYSMAATMVQVLRRVGDNLTRENVMKQAASLSFAPPMLYPGIEVKTSADDFSPIAKKVLQRFNGKSYEAIGAAISG